MMAQVMSQSMHKALFVTFEGGEGAGKSSLMERLSRELYEQGLPVVMTREPGGTKLGETIRQLLLDTQSKVAARAELLLFLAARAQHVEEVIRPALKSGKVVFCDRFNDSTVAYQGIARGLGKEFVAGLCETVIDLTPDLTFFLDVDPKVGLERTQRMHKKEAQAGQLDRIEKEALAFHEKVREAFHEIANNAPHRVHTLDATLPRDIVLKEASYVLHKALR